MQILWEEETWKQLVGAGGLPPVLLDKGPEGWDERWQKWSWCSKAAMGLQEWAEKDHVEKSKELEEARFEYRGLRSAAGSSTSQARKVIWLI